MPSTFALIHNMFHHPNQRAMAISVWMVCFSAGGVLGPAIGGILLEYFWWGSVFLLGVPVMLLLLVTGPFLLPEYKGILRLRSTYGVLSYPWQLCFSWCSD